MTQLSFDGMPEPLYPATPARLGTYAASHGYKAPRGRA